MKARRALDLIDTLDELSSLDPERNRSSAAITVRFFFQAELQTIVGKDWLTMLSSWAAASVPARLRPRCQQLCAHIGSVGFVYFQHLSCVPSS